MHATLTHSPSHVHAAQCEPLYLSRARLHLPCEPRTTGEPMHLPMRPADVPGGNAQRSQQAAGGQAKGPMGRTFGQVGQKTRALPLLHLINEGFDHPFECMWPSSMAGALENPMWPCAVPYSPCT